MMSRILRLETTESTNRDAMNLALEGAAAGTAVIAETQSEGRGRLDRKWQSPAGKGLYCSIILRPEIRPENFPQITFVAGLAVVEAISSLYGLQPKLKWPNDVYFGGRKCGGILTESSGIGSNHDDNTAFAIVGIGLNVNTSTAEFTEEVADTATSLFIEDGKQKDIDKLFYTIRDNLLARIERFEKTGFAEVISEWREYDLLLGKRMSWVGVGGDVVCGVSLGPDGEGRLHVRDDEGQMHEVISGDIQLAQKA